MMNLFGKITDHLFQLERRSHGKNLDFEDWPDDEAVKTKIKRDINSMSNMEFLQLISDGLETDDD